MDPGLAAPRIPGMVPPLSRPRRAGDDTFIDETVRPTVEPEARPVSGAVMRLSPLGPMSSSSGSAWSADDFDAEPSADDLEAHDEAPSGTDSASAPGCTNSASTLAPALGDEQLTELILSVVERNQQALERLYDATSARVHGLVLRITQQSALAEEVVEETYWQVWRQAPRFDPARGRPITWLLAMARSRAIDALRRDQRFVHDELPDDDTAEAMGGAAPPPQDLLDATRANDRLHLALSGLDARARQLVSLAFFRGLTHEEIAEQERLPLGTVKSLIRRSLQQLRRLVEAVETEARDEVSR